MTALSDQSFPALLFAAATKHGDRVFLPRRNPQGGDPIRFSDLLTSVRELAAGLLQAGVQKGDKIGLISENCFEWILCDLACGAIGAVDVPRGTDTPVEELLFILSHSEAGFTFVADTKTAEALESRRAELPHLRDVCVMDGEAPEDGPTLKGLLERGRAALSEDPGLVDRATAAIEPEDLLTIIYTSGTTANPKGVMLTHRNLSENVRMVEERLHFGYDDVALSILPSWHSYERIFDYVMLFAGGQLVYSDRRLIKKDLESVRPTIFVAVPRVWEMLYDGLTAKVHKLEGAKGKLLRTALRVSQKVGAGEASFLDRLTHKLLSRSILPKLLAAVTGGRMTTAVSGGGSLPAHVDQTLLGIGMPLLNGYGLTETSPVAALRVPEDNRPGTIGHPAPRTTIEIRDAEGNKLPQGETGIVWIKGPQLMRGYYRNEEATKRVLVDGWFDSGDLGTIDPDGHVRITGRAKDTIVLAGGENVEPERIEIALKTSPLIEQAVVVGQDRKNLGAVLVPHTEMLESKLPRDQWGANGIELSADEVRSLFRSELDQIVTPHNGFRPLEKIATFRVISEPLSAENGLLTQTMKIKRHTFHDVHGDLIEAMYSK